jgi:cytoskeletal protein CcmA (bactofilin family)
MVSVADRTAHVAAKASWAMQLDSMRKRVKAWRSARKSRTSAQDAASRARADSSSVTFYVNAGSRLYGDLHCAPGVAHIDGEVLGNVVAESASSVALGSSALVNGCVSAPRVIVSGCVRGDIIASSHVLVRAGALIIGDIYCRRVAVQAGGVVRGRLWQHGERPALYFPLIIHPSGLDAPPMLFQEAAPVWSGDASDAALAEARQASDGNATLALDAATTSPQSNDAAADIDDAAAFHAASARKFLRRLLRADRRSV